MPVNTADLVAAVTALYFSGTGSSPAPAAWTVVEGTSGYMSAAAFGQDFLCLRHAGMAIDLVDPLGNAVRLASVGEGEIEMLSEPSIHGSRAAFLVSTAGGGFIRLIDATGAVEEEIGGSGVMGRPAWDETGRLWYTEGGRVMIDGASTDLLSEASTISPSPDGSAAAWSEGDSRLFIGRVEDGSVDTLDLPAPALPAVWTGGSALLVPLLDGTIMSVGLDGATAGLFARGDGVAWNPAMAVAAVSRSTDDGHFLTGAEVVLIAPGGWDGIVGTPEGCAPISPRAAPWGFTAVDANTGAVMLVRLDMSVCRTGVISRQAAIR